jgi:hypothetical protein
MGWEPLAAAERGTVVGDVRFLLAGTATSALSEAV